MKQRLGWNLAAAIFTIILATSCRGWWDGEMVTDNTREIRLVIDSADVQRFIANQSALYSRDRMEAAFFSRRETSLLQELEQRKTVRDRSAIKNDLDELYKHPENYVPERIAFLDAMEQAPGFKVPPKTSCTILRRSEAICSRQPRSNSVYVKVGITSGALKGREGWGCEFDGIFRSVILP